MTLAAAARGAGGPFSPRASCGGAILGLRRCAFTSGANAHSPGRRVRRWDRGNPLSHSIPYANAPNRPKRTRRSCRGEYVSRNLMRFRVESGEAHSRAMRGRVRFAQSRAFSHRIGRCALAGDELASAFLPISCADASNRPIRTRAGRGWECGSPDSVRVGRDPTCCPILESAKRALLKRRNARFGIAVLLAVNFHVRTIQVCFSSRNKNTFPRSEGSQVGQVSIAPLEQRPFHAFRITPQGERFAPSVAPASQVRIARFAGA